MARLYFSVESRGNPAIERDEDNARNRKGRCRSRRSCRSSGLRMSLTPLVRTVTMGTTTVRLKTGTTGTMGNMSTARRVLWLVPGVLVYSLPVAFSG